MLWETQEFFVTSFTTFHLSTIGMIILTLRMPVCFKHHFITSVDHDKIIFE